MTQAQHTLSRFSLFKAFGAGIYLPYVLENTAADPSVTKDRTNRDVTYYDDAAVAELLGISIVRLRNKISAGEPLPPRLQPKGMRKRLWPRKELHDWLRDFQKGGVGHAESGFLRR